MNIDLRPETADAILSDLALIEALDRGDTEAIQALTPRTLTDANRHLRAALMLLAALADLTGWILNDARRALIHTETQKD